MHMIFQSLNFSDYNHTILWAACCLGSLGILCAGEFTDNSHLNPEIHIAVSDVHINTKCSTTDSFHQGCYIYISAEKHDLCPITLPYPAVSTCLWLNFWPTFPSLWGTPLNWQWLTSGIQSILSAAGVPGCYIGHSFCIGTAISAASCGLPDLLIKMLSKWSSDAYQIYIHTLMNQYYCGGSKPTQLTWLYFLHIFLLSLLL